MGPQESSSLSTHILAYIFSIFQKDLFGVHALNVISPITYGMSFVFVVVLPVGPF